MKKYTKFFVFELLYLLTRTIYPHQKAFFFGRAIGDDLLMTSVAENYVRSNLNAWFFTHHPAVFRGYFKNRNIKVFDLKKRTSKYLLAHCLEKNFVTILSYTERDFKNDYDAVPPKHIIKIMNEKAGLDENSIFSLRPYFFIKESEINRFKLKSELPIVAIQSTGKSAIFHMANKEWGYDNFQYVVDCLKNQLCFVQVGSANDPHLTGAIDRRGTTLLQTAAILKNSKMFVGLVGMLMHLSRAVDTKSVIIYGGREHPDQTGYKENTNIYNGTNCSPCWRWNTCDFDNKCMKAIAPFEVVEELKSQLLK